MSSQLRKMKILIVHAHPGDICCEGAGTVALHVERGDEVHCLVVSDGERHHNDLLHREYSKLASERNPKVMNTTNSDIKAYKRDEAQRMCDFLGIKKMYAFGWSDVCWSVTHERIEQIAEVIREVKPDIVLAHMPWGELQAPMIDVHAMLGQMTRMAVRYCSDSLPQIDGMEPHHTKGIYYFPMMGMSDTAFTMGSGIVCDIWIDITSVVEKKVQVIDMLLSQGYQGACARKIVEAREGRWGSLCGCSYAEPWIRDRAVRYSHLPVRPEDLEKKYIPNDLPGDLLLCKDIPERLSDQSLEYPLPSSKSAALEPEVTVPGTWKKRVSRVTSPEVDSV
jgi:4-oxalomesaconate hydratase